MRFPIIRLSVASIILGALAAGAITASAWAAAENAITPGQTIGRMGECMTVEGQVTLHPSMGRFGDELRFENGNGFVGYVPQSAALGDLARFDGQTVDLTGVIEPGQHGLTQIQVTSPEQIMMADETPDRLITCDHS